MTPLIIPHKQTNPFSDVMQDGQVNLTYVLSHHYEAPVALNWHMRNTHSKDDVRF